jgi:O-antigen ligase
LHEINLHPLLGSGYGARIFHGEAANSFIVDDQWLSTGIETGMLGVLAWAWLFTRFLRRIFAAARRERGDRGWLFTAIAASVTAFVVGMFTYDAFSFIQTMFVLFFLLGLGCASLSLESERPAVQP